MQYSPPISMRPLGTPRLPRRRFAPPAAVRVAQFFLVTRIALVGGLLLTAGLSAAPLDLRLPAYGHVLLPGATTWRSLALWLLAGAVFETVLVLRLGHLRTGSRRVILLVESAVIALSGLYTAAGLEIALVPLTGAIAAVVLLRLDHVRHSFNRASAQRRLRGPVIPAVLFEGYAPSDPSALKEVQAIGYAVGSPSGRADGTTVERSRA